jgi:hypothetical protein
LKHKDILFKEIIDKFAKEHPELTANTGNALQQLLTAEKQVYSRIAILYTLEYILEEIARTSK